MFFHQKDPIHTVQVDTADPRFAQLLLEQFGGATGELSAALIKLSTDDGTLKTLHHLLTREISHTQMFMKALDSLGKLTDPFFGNVQPDETVKLYYNLSTDSSGKDERGPWNSEPDFEYIADPLNHSSKSASK